MRGAGWICAVFAMFALHACGRIHFDPISDAGTMDATMTGDGGVRGDGAMACRTETETCDQVTLVCCSDLICIDIGGTMRCD